MGGYAHYIVLLFGMITVGCLYWMICRNMQPIGARAANCCRRCGHDLSAKPDCCPGCGMENDYDDDTAGELDTHLLQNEWPATPVTQRIAELSEQAVTLHSTFRVSEATLLHEQLVARGFACRIDTTVALGTAYNVQVYAKDLAAAKEYVRGLRRAARMRLTLAH